MGLLLKRSLRTDHRHRSEQGTIAWMVPNGEGPREHPLLKPLNLPPLGHPGRSAPLATKTLLFVGEGDPIMASPERTPKSMPLSLAPGAGGAVPRMIRLPVRCCGRPSFQPARRVRR